MASTTIKEFYVTIASGSANLILGVQSGDKLNGTTNGTLTATGIRNGFHVRWVSATDGYQAESILTSINLTSNVSGTLPVANGGTGATTLTDHGVVLGSGTDPVSITAAGSAGQPLLSGGASADPDWGTLGRAYGGIGATSAAYTLNTQNGNYDILASDFTDYRTLVHSSVDPHNYTLLGVGNIPAAGLWLRIVNYGAGAITLLDNGVNINGDSTGDIVIAGGTKAYPSYTYVVTTGSGYVVTVQPSALNNVTAASTFTSGNLVGAAGNDKTTSDSGVAITNVPLLNAANEFSHSTGQKVTKLLIPGSGSGTLTIAAPSAAGTAVFTPPGTTSDLSATGGTGHVLKQATLGGAIGSGTIACADLSNGGLQCSRGELSGAVVTSGSNATALAAKYTNRAITFSIGDPTGSALTTANYSGYATVPFACTLSAWHMVIDAADATVAVEILRVATGGTDKPSASITSTPLTVSTGTLKHSATVTEFSSTAIAVNDTVVAHISTGNTAKSVDVTLQCDQPTS
jgi:hypothetical protein